MTNPVPAPYPAPVIDDGYHMYAAENALRAADAAADALDECDAALEQFNRAAKAATDAAVKMRAAREALKIALRDLNAASVGYLGRIGK